MTIHIQTKNMDLSMPIKEYIDRRMSSLSKFGHVINLGVPIQVSIGKSTNHHKSGNIYRAEIIVSVSGKNIVAESEMEDLYASIDKAQEELIREITSLKTKRHTLWRRGAQKIKKMLRGNQ